MAALPWPQDVPRVGLGILKVAAVLAPLLLAGASQAATREYRVDTERSTLFVQAYRSGLLSWMGHDHLFVPQRWSGQITFDPEAPERAQVRLQVAADSLKDHEPGLSASDRAKVERQARTEVLEAQRFPTIDFVSDRLEVEVAPEEGQDGVGAEGGRLHGQLVGTLTLHGRSKAVRVPFSATVTSQGVTGSGAVRVSLKEFGIEPASAALGTVSVKDEVDVVFDLRAMAAGADR